MSARALAWHALACVGCGRVNFDLAPIPSTDGALPAGSVVVSIGERADATYRGVTDTQLASTSPSLNFGSEVELTVAAGNQLTTSIIRFDLSPLAPQSYDVLAAELAIAVSNGAEGTQIRMFRLLEAWTDDALFSAPGIANWTERTGIAQWTVPGATDAPSRSTELIGSLVPDQVNQRYRISLLPAGRAAVQDWIDTPSSNAGMVFDIETDNFTILSSNASAEADRPLLTLVLQPR